jgi:DNA-binding MarR family transcriptional regulator/GNAT superfamily N-acetyltransferase
VSAVVDERVVAVREFNRFYTGAIGVLEEGLLDTPYTLTEARVIFELAQRDATEVADIRQALGIDAGYLSRILSRFQADGLVARERSEIDGRRQVVRLTQAGRAAYRLLDGRSAEQVLALLTRLTDADQRRLLAGMAAIRRAIVGADSADACRLRPLRPGDLGWVVYRHGVLYAEQYGWDHTFEELVARIVTDYVDNRDPERTNAWIAELDGVPAGSVFCGAKDERTAQLRLLLVEPSARGMGVGSRLVDECIGFARRAGYREITLWTFDALADARRIYQRAGFRLVHEEPQHRFGHDMVSQHWSRAL